MPTEYSDNCWVWFAFWIGTAFRLFGYLKRRGFSLIGHRDNGHSSWLVTVASGAGIALWLVTVTLRNIIAFGLIAVTFEKRNYSLLATFSVAKVLEITFGVEFDLCLATVTLEVRTFSSQRCSAPGNWFTVVIMASTKVEKTKQNTVQPCAKLIHFY